MSLFVEDGDQGRPACEEEQDMPASKECCGQDGVHERRSWPPSGSKAERKLASAYVSSCQSVSSSEVDVRIRYIEAFVRECLGSLLNHGHVNSIRPSSK